MGCCRWSQSWDCAHMVTVCCQGIRWLEHPTSAAEAGSGSCARCALSHSGSNKDTRYCNNKCGKFKTYWIVHSISYMNPYFKIFQKYQLVFAGFIWIIVNVIHGQYTGVYLCELLVNCAFYWPVLKRMRFGASRKRSATVQFLIPVRTLFEPFIIWT